MTALKRLTQESIRLGHLWFCSGPLTPKLGIYFHQIELSEHDQIRELVRSLREKGYRFAGNPSDFINEKEQPVAFLSIDDNFRTSYELLGLAEELDICFTIYANTVFFREADDQTARQQYVTNLACDFQGPFVSHDELREISAAGHCIGAHTHSHRQLSVLSHEDAVQEIVGCKERLEEILGKPVVDFAYPFGMRRHFSERLRTFCGEAGFQTVANAIPGMQFAGQSAMSIQRSGWDLKVSTQRNFENLKIDGRRYEKWTGRSAVI